MIASRAACRLSFDDVYESLKDAEAGLNKGYQASWSTQNVSTAESRIDAMTPVDVVRHTLDTQSANMRMLRGGLDAIRQSCVDRVLIRTASSHYGDDADGNRGLDVMEREIETPLVTVEDFDLDALIPLKLTGAARDDAGERVAVQFTLESLDPKAGRAVYRVDFDD